MSLSGSSFPAIAQGLSRAADDVASWISRPRLSRKVLVPNFVGQPASDCFLIAVRSGVQLEFVRLTLDPAPTDGVIVKQAPPPETRIARGATVQLAVVHPAKRTS